MRGRRLLADVVDLVLVLPFAVPLSWVAFGVCNLVFTFFFEELGQQLGLKWPLKQLVLSWVLAWVATFVLARAGNGPTTGERVAGLTPPPGPPSRVKSWIRALFLLDVPLGWVLASRPVERALGIARVRDHTQNGLEALGNAYRKRPGVPVVLGLLVLIPIAAIPAWRDTLESHHRRLIAQTVAEYGDFCGGLLSSDRGREHIRMANAARMLAPETFELSIPPGSPERRSLESAMEVLEGPCEGLEPGDKLPEGARLDPRPIPMVVLFKVKKGVDTDCYRAPGSVGVDPLRCGEVFSVGGRCLVRAQEGRVLLVLADCGAPWQ